MGDPLEVAREEVRMEATEWIIVLVIAVIVIALLAWLLKKQQDKKKHEHAEHMRQEAHQHATEIPEAQVRAKEAEAQAERARLDAERAAQRAEEERIAATQQQAVHEDRLRTADQVDPHVDTRSDDYAPGAGTNAGVHDPDTILDGDHRTDHGTVHGTDHGTEHVTDPRTDGTDGSHRT